MKPSSQSHPKFLLIFLRGAYDSLSLLAPYAEPYYFEARPNLALPPPSAGDGDAVLPIDGRWGLNARVVEDLAPFLENRQLAFVPFAGTSFVSRSHFQAQDWIELGISAGGPTISDSGFMNRLLLELGESSRGGVGFTQSLPLAFRGQASVVNQPPTHHPIKDFSADYENLVLQMYFDHPLQRMVEEGLSLRRFVRDDINLEMQQASRSAPTPGNFARQAGLMGRLLGGGTYSIGFADVGGWDTHVAQGGAQGQLSNRLGAFAEGLTEFRKNMGPAWRETVVVVLSEFGRTFRENGTRGTDHGHGGLIWVLGGGVKGGIHGEQTGMRRQDLHQDRDLPVLNDYRSILGGIFSRMYGLQPEQIGRVFPGAGRSQLDIV